jgi:hypothetical protein
LARAKFQTECSAFIGLHHIAGVNRGADGQIRVVKQRFSRLDDETERLRGGGERGKIEQADYKQNNQK